MPKWITLDSFTRFESGGKAMSATLADEIELHVEASPDHRDVRITDNNHVVKIRLREDWTIRDILVDDIHAWTADDE